MCVILVIATVVVCILIDWLIQRRRRRISGTLDARSLVTAPDKYIQTGFRGEEGSVRDEGARDARGLGPLLVDPIGHVKRETPSGPDSDTTELETVRIVLEPSYARGLSGLHGGQKILVLFWFHRSQGWDLLQHPKGDTDQPKRGVFALRSSRRPNPLGATEVTIVAVEGNVLRVKGLDALDGTPVLDLKPVANTSAVLRTP